MKRIISIIIILAILASALGIGFVYFKDTILSWFNPDDVTENEDPGITDEIPITVNGVSITEYRIVYDSDSLDYNLRAAEYIRDSISAICGTKLEIVDDAEPTEAHEIVVGETSRQISKDLDEKTEGLEFSMLTQSGNVALEGDYFIIAAAAYYFIDTYINVSTEVTIPDGTTVKEPVAKEAKNLILLIGDGMGVYQTLLYDYMTDTSDYSDGEDRFYGYMLPYQGYSRTQSFSGVTDSAAGGTALATGYKTLNEHVGLDRNGDNLLSLTELAAELGKATAVMSTENKTGATPAAFSAHSYDRDDNVDILEDQIALTNKYGTIIDCGYDRYDANSIKRIVEKHISDTLAKVSDDEDGFFLMYEEAHIDKHCHKNDMEKAFLAVIRFNQAIARFMEYAFYNPDTLVLITADHETGALYPDEDGVLRYHYDDHTAENVLTFGWGYGLDVIDGATVENIEIAKLFASLMGIGNFGDQSNDWYSEIYGTDPEDTPDNGDDTDQGDTPGGTVPEPDDDDELIILPV